MQSNPTVWKDLWGVSLKNKVNSFGNQLAFDGNRISSGELLPIYENN